MKDIESEKFALDKRLKSFGYAFNGLKILLKEEHNARIHIAVSAFVILMGILLHISSQEWLIVSVSIGLVISLEIMNSAIENLCDFVSSQKNDSIKKVKDLASAAVLVAVIMSVICGSIIFVPKLYKILINL